MHQGGSFPKFQAERSNKRTAWEATFTSSRALTIVWSKLPRLGDLPAIRVLSPELEAGSHFPLAPLCPFQEPHRVCFLPEEEQRQKVIKVSESAAV